MRGCALLLLMTSAAFAENPGESSNRKWDFSLWAAGATGEENSNRFSEAQIVTAGLFVGRVMPGELGSSWYRGRFEIGMDLAPLFVQLRPQSTHGVAFDPVILRWNSSLRAKRVRPYIELAGGAVHTGSNFPAGDTSDFNFIARGGGGLLISAAHAQALEIGCRWWHISNANLGTRNPEFNGVQLNIGWHWRK